MDRIDKIEQDFFFIQPYSVNPEKSCSSCLTYCTWISFQPRILSWTGWSVRLRWYRARRNDA